MVRIVHAFFLCLLLASCAFAQQVEQAEGSFARFWTEFRAAVLSGDKGRIASLTKFPFEVRGPDDSDPVMQHDKTSFLQLFPALLDQELYTIAGSQVILTSMREIIQHKTQVTSRDILGKNVARVEQFTFVRIRGAWLFNRAYVENVSELHKFFQPAR